MAYRFIDGMNSRINFGSDAFNIGSGDCTYELRFRSDKDSGYFFAKNKASSAFDNRIIARMDEGKFRMYIDWETNATGLTCDTRVDDGEEHMVSIVLDRDGDMTIYLDGEVDGSMDISAHENVNFVSDWPFLFNGNMNASDVISTHTFNGVMDEFRQWNHARTEEQINDLEDVKCVGTEDGLIGLVRFDDAIDHIISKIDSDPDNRTLVHNVPRETSWIRQDFECPIDAEIDRAVTYFSAFRAWAMDDGITVEIWKDGDTEPLASAYIDNDAYDTGSHYEPRMFDFGEETADVEEDDQLYIVMKSYRTSQGEGEQYYLPDNTVLNGNNGRRISNDQGTTWGSEHESRCCPYMVLAFEGEGDGMTVTDAVNEEIEGTISGTRMWYEPFDYPENEPEPSMFKVKVWLDGAWQPLDLRDVHAWDGTEWKGISDIKNNQHGIWF